jgi:hypothetical protein
MFADWTGLEPATSAVTGRHSNQLNYQSLLLKRGKDRTVLLEASNFSKNKYQKYCRSEFTTLRVTFVALLIGSP